MKKIIFYSYLKCSTCRKAAKWLESKDFQFQLIDIVKEPPLVNYLNLLKTRSNKKITRIGCKDSSDGLFQAVQDLAIASKCKAIMNYEKMPKDEDWPTGDKWDEYYFFGGED